MLEFKYKFIMRLQVIYIRTINNVQPKVILCLHSVNNMYTKFLCCKTMDDPQSKTVSV